ncbi:MAG: transcription elongation factor GreA [Peptostreptococcaceae bacterium]
MQKEFLLTKKSYDDLNEELEYLSTTKRLEIAKNLKIAAEYGDLKENSEFDAEKENQAIVESRIYEINNMIMNCKIVENTNDTKNINLGCKVLLFDFEFEEEVTYTIVDTVQADPLENLISYDSPIGRALMNKTVNDEINVELPFGSATFKILETL